MSSVRVECKQCPDIFFDTKAEAAEHLMNKHALIYSAVEPTQLDFEKDMLARCQIAADDVGIHGDTVLQLTCGLVKEIVALRSRIRQQPALAVRDNLRVIAKKSRREAGMHHCPAPGCNYQARTTNWIARHRNKKKH